MLMLGDCLALMQLLPNNSVDSIVTDPPYGLAFMGKKWDYDVPIVEIWAECLRVLKPGGHLLAFASPRTQHRMAVRIEDAGFEIRDMIAWVYGSGFPKSHNGEWGGTALKPALEPITMARKPLIGTVEANWREYGVGALDIDGCRIGFAGAEDMAAAAAAAQRAGRDQNQGRNAYGEFKNGEASIAPYLASLDRGRWPANLIHDGSDEVAALFPAQAGASAPVRGTETSAASAGNVTGRRARVAGAFHADAGSAARFFYCAKASKRDRGEGNTHPTVKPTDLMAYLCRLVTPAGGLVLDPFMGSGSTGKAAVRENFSFIGIEQAPNYFAIAQRRIDEAVSQALLCPDTSQCEQPHGV